MSITVTATETNFNPGNKGMALKVAVLTGPNGTVGRTAAAKQTGVGSPTATYGLSLTPQFNGSLLFGVFTIPTVTATIGAGATVLDGPINYANVACNAYFLASSSTTVSGTPQGFTATASSGRADSDAIAEIAGTSIAVDASTPAAVTSGSATALTTAAFSPPAGAYLVAMTASNTPTSGSALSMAITDTSGGTYTWTQLVQENVVGGWLYADVWLGSPPAAPVNNPGIVALSQQVQGFVNLAQQSHRVGLQQQVAGTVVLSQEIVQ